MAQISPLEKKLKNGQILSLSSPKGGEGLEILRVVKQIMNEGEYLLTEPDEFIVTVEQEEDMIESFLEHPDKLIILPRIDGRMVGMTHFDCGTRRKTAHQGSFGTSVLREFCGIGVGQAMLDALVTWARANPRLEQLRLEVYSKNIPAYSLYRKTGFIEEGRKLRGIKTRDGLYDDMILMALPVK
jgi:RimJ/RimL family protein N-acetyltransferase